MTQNNSEEPGRDLIKVLLAEGVISQAQADLAARDAENMSMGLDDVLLARRWVTEETLQRLAPWLFGGAGSGVSGTGSTSGGAGVGGASASGAGAKSGGAGVGGASASGAGSGSGGAGVGGSSASAGASSSKSNGGAAGSTSAADSNTGAAGAASTGTTGISGSAGATGTSGIAATVGSAGSGSGAGRTSGAGIGRASTSGMKAADKDSQGADAEGLKEMKGSSDDYGENLARYRSIVRQILGNEG